MWLINATTQKLEEFAASRIPRFTILSHTWERNEKGVSKEVTFQDLMLSNPMRVSPDKDFSKIKNTCAETLERGFEYTWVRDILESVEFVLICD